MQTFNSRISNSVANSVVANATGAGRVWKVCLYVRLSRDDGDKAESDSIGKEILS